MNSNGLFSLMAVPINAEGRVIGSLGVATKGTNDILGTNDTKLFQEMANLVGPMFDKIRLENKNHRGDNDQKMKT